MGVAARLLSVASLVPLASAFAFGFKGVDETLAQCQEVEVIWQGGQPPFELLVISDAFTVLRGGMLQAWSGISADKETEYQPSFDYPQNITIPDSAWDAQTESGSWTWHVNYPTGVNLVAMMSDATADGSGGVTSLHKVTAGNDSCSMRSTDADFTFQLNSTYINQCEPIDISWSAYAVAPVTILGVIPHGQPFMMTASNSNSLLRWVPNIAEGTVFMFAAFDNGQYGTGGSSNLYTVSKGSTGCMDSSSPSSTAGTPVMTSGSSRPSNGTQTDNGGVKTVTAIATVYPTESASKGLSTGSIVIIVVVIVVTLLILQAILLWFCCRRQIAALISHRRDMRKKGIKNGEVDLAATRNDPAEMDMDMDIDLTPTYQTTPAGSVTGIGAFGNNKNVSRSRSRPDLAAIDTDADPAHSISPFLDPGTTGRTGLPLLPSPNADPFWSGVSPTSASHSGTAHALAASSDNLSLMPPDTVHHRTDSFGSGRTFDMSRHGSQQDLLPPSGTYAYDSPLGSPVAGSPSGSGSGSQRLGNRPSKASLVAQIELEERTRQLAQQQANARTGQQQPQGSRSLTGAPPSSSARALSIAAEDMLDSHVPAAAPRGGFSRHTDAGPLVPPPRGQEEEVEELPPMYDAEWQTEQRPAPNAPRR